MQRTSEIELSMNSGINLALLAWNLHNAGTVSASQQPSERKWAAVLVCVLLLKISKSLIGLAAYRVRLAEVETLCAQVNATPLWRSTTYIYVFQGFCRDHLCVSRILQGSLHVQDQDVVIVGKHDSCRSKDALWAVLIEDYVTQRKLLLSKDQVQRLLQARSSMMEGLQAAQQSRQSSYASLNHASQVCNCHEWPLHACPGQLIEACALWSFELYVVPYMKLLKVVVERLLGQ